MENLNCVLKSVAGPVKCEHNYSK